jgi:hypothetical protein
MTPSNAAAAAAAIAESLIFASMEGRAVNLRKAGLVPRRLPQCS